MERLDLPDIQGIVLRGYRMPMIRYFLFKVNDAAQARSVLGRLAAGPGSDGLRFTTAEEWQVAIPGPLDDPKASPGGKPHYCLNVGITWAGLDALGVTSRIPAIESGSFDAFTEGAAARAARVGDTGANGPENWTGGFGGGADHVMMALHTAGPAQMETYSAALTAALGAGNAFEELWHQDGAVLKFEEHAGQMVPVPVLHFGYTDGITATPPIIGGPEPAPADHQQPCEPWLFVLGDDAGNYDLPQPHQLWRNGSFGVFKMVEQDVVGFEDFLQSNKERIDPELLAAKLMGRWRNGTPLALTPESDTPAGGITPEQLNDFEYVNADGSGDPRGIRCPVGAHIRRVNPRGQPVAGQGTPGGSNNTHRMLRRGAPYGPWYDPTVPYDGIERGLLGYFINTYIENQYEFVMRQWTGSGEFAGRVRLNPKAKDPLIGNNDPAGSVFDIPQPSGPPLKITGFQRFTTTRAVAYCFLPSMTALRWISSIPETGATK
jgi:deferrochelatase/peroxidase EfeB